MRRCALLFGILLLAYAAGCSSSRLAIGPRDTTFLRAEQRIIRTAHLVGLADRSAPTPHFGSVSAVELAAQAYRDARQRGLSSEFADDVAYQIEHAAQRPILAADAAAPAHGVDLDSPTEAERWLFMQAEGFYQYRFAFPPHGLLSYLALAAAAITDFPALQSLAGSVDLVDLRLRSYDGAVHLWETLLVQHPKTALRPLTLYRLGWAYRSTAVSGFPRKSGDEAFNLLMKDYPGSPLAHLSREAKAVPWKSKDKATGFSLVPGLAQMYVGEYKNGAARLGVALGAAAMIIAPSAIAIDRGQDLTWSGDWPLLLSGLLGLVVLSIDYTSSYQDAMRGVGQFNERKQAAFEDGHPEAP